MTCWALAASRKKVRGDAESVHAWQVTFQSGWCPTPFPAFHFFAASVFHASGSAFPVPASPASFSVAGFSVSVAPVLSVSRLSVSATSASVALAFVSGLFLPAFFYAATLLRAFRMTATGYKVRSLDARRPLRDQHIGEGYCMHNTQLSLK